MKKLLFMFVFAVTFGLGGTAWGQTAEVSWTAPTSRVDGSPLSNSEISGYDVTWYNCEQGNRQTDRTANVTTWTREVGYGCWRFEVQTVDVDGLVSDPAGPVEVTYKAPPNPPTLITVNRVAYEAKIHPTKGLVAGRVVGSATLGAPCFANADGQPFTADGLYGVDRDMVALFKEPKSDLILVECAPSQG